MNRASAVMKPRILLLGFRRFSELVYSVMDQFASEAELAFHDTVASDKIDYQALLDRYHPDVIMSAGANAAFLANTLSVPVVSQPVKESDIIEACFKAKKVSDRIHLFTYGAGVPGRLKLIKYLSELLEITLVHRHYLTSDEASEQFYLALAEKPGVIVGPSYSCHLAEKEGIPSILLYSRESAVELVETAIRVAHDALERARQKAIQTHLFDETDDMLLLLDSDRNLVKANEAARTSLLKSNRLSASDRNLLQLHDIQTLHTERWVSIKADRFLQVVDVIEHNDHHMAYLVRYRSPQSRVSAVANAEAPASFVVRSRAMSRVASLSKTYAVAHGAVMIIGESGTGKEHIAREIHRHSRYANGPLVAVNCGSLPSELFESEMFGYEEGAFTNSRRGGHRGLLEQANHGVLFLDEIAEMPMAHQSKLLRVLQDKILKPIGSERSISLNLKVVAATNRPLHLEVEEGRFREDLFYRLNTFTLELPPLRERKEDIAAISVYYLNRFAGQYGLPVDAGSLYQSLASHFERYRWPGNVRELESFCERVVVAVMVEPSYEITESLLQTALPEVYRTGASFSAANGAIRQSEMAAIEAAMELYQGDRQAVADYLGISTTTLWRRLKNTKTH